jgi:hypothetical protein
MFPAILMDMSVEIGLITSGYKSIPYHYYGPGFSQRKITVIWNVTQYSPMDVFWTEDEGSDRQAGSRVMLLALLLLRIL